MLTRIHIRDFAIIDELELEFGPGMSVLTGETGAGKSILIGALGLVLGDRADAGTVRDGAARAEIALGLDIEQRASARDWLKRHDLEADGECLLRRVITRDGRSRAYINGSPAALQLLRQFGEMLVDIHGQHEHQSLLRNATQRELLDAHAGNDTRLARLTEIYHELRALREQVDGFAAQARERENRIDLLRFQLRDLTQLALGEGEFDALGEEHRRLAHAGQLRDITLGAYLALYEGEDETVDARIGQMIGDLETLRELDGALREPLELLAAAQAELREAASLLRRYADGLEPDPQRLAWVEARISDIHDLARKHRLTPAEIPDRHAELQAQLEALEDPEYDLERLSERLRTLEDDYQAAARGLHAARVAAASNLSAGVTAAMQELGLAGGRFEIKIEFDDTQNISPHGLDRIEFQVSANPGQPLAPLARVASGGELSRISLAIQIKAAQDLSIPTLIFDEVDSGIGGAVAEVVGRQLRRLSERRQVLCVTHLAQVAAQTHHHYQVSKRTQGRKTRTRVAMLKDKERVDEIARMLGGVEVTDKTRAHAQEMISRAKNSNVKAHYA
ncbi:MAG: DNA repair protein RecN [Gammaproteobacteria bacterium]